MKASIHFLLKIFIGFLSLGFIAYAQTNTDSKNIQAVLETTAGNITLDLFPEVGPTAGEKFVTHINNRYYNGTIFHRTIRNCLLQGLDPTDSGHGG